MKKYAVLTLVLLMLFAVAGQTFAADGANTNTDRNTVGNRTGTVNDLNRDMDMNNFRANDGMNRNNDMGFNRMNDNGVYNRMNNDVVRANAADGTDWGWLGLLGLIGLAGMFGRNRDEREA